MEIKEQMSVTDLEAEIQWFETLLEQSLSNYFQDIAPDMATLAFEAPTLSGNSAYAQFVEQHELDFAERFVLILALMPKLKPQALDLLLVKNNNLGGEYTEFGRFRNSNRNGFIPTLETAFFLLTHAKLHERLKLLEKINARHHFFTTDVLLLDAEQDSLLDQRLQVSTEYEQYFLHGTKALPQFGSKFPAREISTELNWEDLVVEHAVLEDLKEIEEWLIHSQTILHEWEMKSSLKAGYRALFYGPPGTGKTLAATLLGKQTQRPVFRIDLSAVVSKYIGETEKNLAKLFDLAASKDWILFFDEADALFGKRTATKGSNDRYANQEVAYLLQRIEDFNGLVILATNLQSNIDEAFSRRFQSTIYFSKPKIEERRKLWQNLLFSNFEMENVSEIERELDKYELSGGQMINVLRYCAIQAAKRQEKRTTLIDIITGIKREYSKESKTL